MSIYIPTIQSRHSRESSTVAGNAATKLFSATTVGLQSRAGVEIVNNSSTYNLYIKAVARGAAAPTITSTDKDYMLAPDSTITINWGSPLDIYVMNSSGSAATGNVTAYEVLT